MSSAADQIFLYACGARAPDDWDPLRDELVRAVAPDWRAVTELAARFRLSGLIARNLKWAVERLGIELSELQPLEEAHRSARLRNLAMKARLVRVLQNLEAAGIQCVPVKGVVLAEEIYGGLSLRTFSDHDILVSEDHITQAIEVCRGLGYRAMACGDYEYRRGLGYDQVELRDPSGELVELHWNLFEPREVDTRASAILENCRNAPDGVPGLRLSAPMAAVHLASHFVHHDFIDFRILVDFHRALWAIPDTEFDPYAIYELGDHFGQRAAVNLAAMLCGSLFPAKFRAMELLEGQRVVRSTIVKALLTTSRLLHSSRNTDLLNRTIRLMFMDPPTKAIRNFFGWVLPSPREIAMGNSAESLRTLYFRHYRDAFRRRVRGRAAS